MQATALRRLFFPLILLVGVLLLLTRLDDPAPDIHQRIQQRLIEAELGSATSFYLAAGPRAAQPPTDTPLPEVLVQLNSSQPEQRWAAAGELSARRDPRAVEAVIRAMRDPQDTVRVCLMASTLGYLHDPRALGPLTEAAFDPNNRDLRLCAIESLGMLGDRRAVPDLIRALETRNMPIAAANAIARMGDERGLMPLITAAEDPMLGLWMISALGELGSTEALPYLEGRINENVTLRQAVTEARWKIGRLSVRNPTQALAHTLSHDPQKTHRAWAAFRLGELRHTDAVAALLGALSDNNNGVRERAAAALIRIGTPARAAVLTHTAKSGTSQPYAVAVLGYIGELADIVHLQPLAESNSALLSTVAARSTALIRKFNAVEHTSVLC